MSYAAWKARLSQGNAFDDDDVARCYAHRPPYAPALYARLLGLVPRKEQLVDLGCGPGKVTENLAPHFARTLALDPAAAMIAEAKRQHPGSTITWLHAGAEDAALPDRIDLVAAGTSIHWMNHAVLFPKLAERNSLLAVMYVAAQPAPQREEAHRTVLTDWLARVDQVYDPVDFPKRVLDYEPWLDKQGHETFTAPFAQTVDGYIEAMHSSATFSRARMGPDLAAEFARDLRATLAPHTQNGVLTFETVSTLVWGKPRSALP